jgi:2-C-methyl-D-erythritol 4-phosphate cytidylyltransferase/2-C-methyl-D-erythritol 2,4-cyclodiphosphate synthase
LTSSTGYSGALAEQPGRIPVLPVVDSLAVADTGLMAGSADREALRRVQTPQAFRYDAILSAHRRWTDGQTAGDDAQVAHAAGLAIALVEGERTAAQADIRGGLHGRPALPATGTATTCTGLPKARSCGCVASRLAHDRGLVGHSDADVALHAVVDAILGAAGAGDIGQHFPPSDPQWRGAPSSRFVEHAVELARLTGLRIGNVDLTIVCEAPKIGPHRDAMRARLAELPRGGDRGR